MTHHASPEFWNCYRTLPSTIREQADRAFELLKTDPQHPSLHFKKIGRFWSARVGLHYRALAVETLEGVLWFWIGSHAEYDKLDPPDILIPQKAPHPISAPSSQPQRAGFPLTIELHSKGLPKNSWVKVSQIRTLAVERVGQRLGKVSAKELAQVIKALNELSARKSLLFGSPFSSAGAS